MLLRRRTNGHSTRTDSRRFRSRPVGRPAMRRALRHGGLRSADIGSHAFGSAVGTLTSAGIFRSVFLAGAIGDRRTQLSVIRPILPCRSCHYRGADPPGATPDPVYPASVTLYSLPNAHSTTKCRSPISGTTRPEMAWSKMNSRPT